MRKNNVKIKRSTISCKDGHYVIEDEFEKDKDDTKCFTVTEEYSGISAAVFAKNDSRARCYAWSLRDKLFDGSYYDYMDFNRATRVRRLPEGDKWYKPGKELMDWDNPEDRIVLCEELGWACVDETDYDCPNCPAKDVCQRYLDEKCDLLVESEDLQ